MKDFVDEKCYDTKKWLNELHRLKCQQHYIEKVNGANQVIAKLSSNNSLAKQILNRYDIGKKNSVADDINFRDRLSCINDLVCSLRTDAIYDENLQKNDLQYYKDQVLNIENEIKLFETKIYSELENIKNDFNFEEINALVTHLKQRAALAKEFSVKSFNMTPTNINMSKNNKKDASEYNMLLKAGGSNYGNWTPEEHTTFVRAKQRCKDNVQSMIRIIQRVMPDMSEKEIMDHNEWHMKYEAMREEQRAEIRRWREEKRSRGGVAASQEEASKEGLQRDQTEPSSKETLIRDRKERAETKRRIEQWKQRKIDQKRAEEEQREKMIKEIREKDSSKVLKEVLCREAVSEWKIKRRMDAQKILLQKEIDHMHNMQKSMEANRALSEFRAQDQKYIARRRETSLIRGKQQGIGCAPGPLSHRGPAGAGASRDPQRLLRPTEASARRSYRQSHPAASEPLEAEAQRLKEQARSLSVRTIPKLGVPSWRKETRNA